MDDNTRQHNEETVQFTATSRSLSVSATLAVNALVNKRRARGLSILHMGFGEASLPIHPLLEKALQESAHFKYYAPVLGIPELRETISSYLSNTRGIKSTYKQVIVGPGSKSIIYALLQIYEGDVLLPAPTWVSYAPMAHMLGKRIAPVQTDTLDNHRLTEESLNIAIISARKKGLSPKILIINSPSNPTGSMFTQEDVIAIAKWCRKEGVILISDEIYAELAHGWREHTSPFLYYPENCIVTGGLSKSFAAGGWRLGYAVLPETLNGQKSIDALRAVGSELWSSASTPIQKAAIEAYKNHASVDEYVQRNAQIYGFISKELYETFETLGVSCPKPAGGFYLYPDFSKWRQTLNKLGIKTSDDLSEYLIDEWNIATLPASEFYDDPFAMRLRLATSMLVLPKEARTDHDRDKLLRKIIATTGSEKIPGTFPLLDVAREKWTKVIKFLEHQALFPKTDPKTLVIKM